MTDPFAWQHQGAAGKVIAVLNKAGNARFVGGCVRDSLLGMPPGPPGRTDIDIATTLLPEETQKCLETENIKVVPTGLEHGTVTAIIDHVPIEITTLRADVSTDGRRATVAFTDDWETDARRRDFTINAMFLTQDGEIIDLVGGQDDLAARKVQFIGKPEDRIKEDYLRILRFIRFSSRFTDQLDARSWAACVDLRQGLASLSKERIWHEISKTFPQAQADRVLSAAAEQGVLDEIIPVKSDPALFAKVHKLDRLSVTPALGLFALWPTASRKALQTAFKPPARHLDQVEAIRTASQFNFDTEHHLAEALYRCGRESVMLTLHYLVAKASDDRLHRKRQQAAAMDIPVFPLAGADFVAAGLPPGPSVGKALKKAEQSWIDQRFPTTPKDIETIMAETVDEFS